MTNRPLVVNQRAAAKKKSVCQSFNSKHERRESDDFDSISTNRSQKVPLSNQKLLGMRKIQKATIIFKTQKRTKKLKALFARLLTMKEWLCDRS